MPQLVQMPACEDRVLRLQGDGVFVYQGFLLRYQEQSLDVLQAA
jgi:hypothetical protein